MVTERIVLRGETALHLLRRVSIDTLRAIELDLRDATFGDEHIFAHHLARQILADREKTRLEAEDTLVSEVEWDD